MQLHDIQPKTKRRTEKRIGRGGKRGKTSGKGGKGQTARAGGRPRPEFRDIIKRLPKRRGYGKNRSRTVNPEHVRPFVVNVGSLNDAFGVGAEVNPKTIIATGLIVTRATGVVAVKILGGGELSKKLSVSGCTVSGSAKQKIEAAGGTIL